MTLGHMPDGDLIWREYDRALTGALVLQPALIRKDVARLQLLTAEDIEVLRDLVREGTSIADLLDRKDAEPVWNMGFKNFLFNIMPDRLRKRGVSRQEELNRLRSRIVELVAGQPQANSPSGPPPQDATTTAAT